MIGEHTHTHTHTHTPFSVEWSNAILIWLILCHNAITMTLTSLNCHWWLRAAFVSTLFHMGWQCEHYKWINSFQYTSFSNALKWMTGYFPKLKWINIFNFCVNIYWSHCPVLGGTTDNMRYLWFDQIHTISYIFFFPKCPQELHITD